MIKDRDIVVVGIQAWDIEIGSNCKNIALEFSKHNRVLYVNPPLDRATLKRERESERIQKRLRIKNGEEKGLVEVDSNLWNLYPKTMTESINWIPFHGLFKMLNRRNSKKFAKDIKDAMHQLGFKDILVFNDLGFDAFPVLLPIGYFNQIIPHVIGIAFRS